VSPLPFQERISVFFSKLFAYRSCFSSPSADSSFPVPPVLLSQTPLRAFSSKVVAHPAFPIIFLGIRPSASNFLPPPLSYAPLLLPFNDDIHAQSCLGKRFTRALTLTFGRKFPSRSFHLPFSPPPVKEHSASLFILHYQLASVVRSLCAIVKQFRPPFHLSLPFQTQTSPFFRMDPSPFLRVTFISPFSQSLFPYFGLTTDGVIFNLFLLYFRMERSLKSALDA